jgi:hypothetical protein
MNELDLSTYIDKEVLDRDIMHTEIMNKIIIQIYNGWPGKIGLERVVEKVFFLAKRVQQYAKVMDKSEIETLELLAESKDCNYMNYFQNANIPDISDVYVFNTIEEFLFVFPSKKYICPCCGGISTNHQECNSGKNIDKESTEACNWKVYGLFFDMNKGIRVIIKSTFTGLPRPIKMFKPIEMK